MGPKTEGASSGFCFVKYKMFMFKYIKIGSKEQELLWVDFYV